MGRKLDHGIKAIVGGGNAFTETLHHDQVQFAEPGRSDMSSPALQGRLGVRQQRRTINEEDRLAVDSDVIFRSNDPFDVPDEGKVIFRGMPLGNENIAVFAIPAARPIFVGPANAKGKGGFPRFNHSSHREIQQDFAAEPIVIETKTMKARRPG